MPSLFSKLFVALGVVALVALLALLGVAAFFSSNQQVVLLCLLFAGVIVVLVLVLWLIVRHLVVRPLRILNTTTQKFVSGDLSQRASVKPYDELGQIAGAFNQMAQKLQSIYIDLEDRSSERTLQLMQRVKEAETERARDEAILAGMGEGLIALDDQSRVVLVNVRAAELVGIPRDVLFGRTPEQTLGILHDEQDLPLPADKAPHAMARTLGKSVHGVYIYHKRNGQKMSLDINATPIFTEKQVVGVVMVARDVTKEKEVDRMKTEFISLASHQLRTPLSAIKWFSEMLLAGDAGKLNPEQEDFARNVADSTERMIELVNSLLNISRIESGRIIIDPKPTDLRQLVAGIVNDLKAKTEEKHQSLVISVHKDLPLITLDPRLISQVYLNLLTNAIKYTPKGGEIMVLISRQGDEVLSQVTDNGYGIPKDQQDKVFQKLFRADNVIKVETDGTGLGLYLVKAIIESSGGKVWFASEEGKGSTFWFTLPITGMQSRAGEVTLDS